MIKMILILFFMFFLFVIIRNVGMCGLLIFIKLLSNKTQKRQKCGFYDVPLCFFSIKG